MCGKELGRHGVTMVSLWPGLVQTEHIMSVKDNISEAKVVGKNYKDLENSEFSLKSC